MAAILPTGESTAIVHPDGSQHLSVERRPRWGPERIETMTSASFNRPGAVDLSALKQKAQQATAPTGPSNGGGTYVVEVTEQTFEAETIRRSVTHPVVVELYSPRVPTGQQLSDTLA